MRRPRVIHEVIAQGSTPTITIHIVDEIPFEAISKWIVSIMQNHQLLFTKTGDDVYTDPDLRLIEIDLSQEETLKLDSRYPCFVQVKALSYNNTVIPMTLEPVYIYPVENKEVVEDGS